MTIKQINICLNKKKVEFELEEIDEYTNLSNLKLDIIRKFNLDCLSKDFFLKETKTGKLLTNNLLNELTDKIELDIIFKLKGGVIDGIVKMLMGIIKMFTSLYKILKVFFDLIGYAFDMIPVIFDPPALMNDVLFAVTYGINQVFKSTTTSVKDGANSPEDETGPRGPFDIDATAPKKCIDPTLTTIILLIICPPLAIIYKLGFMAGLVSSIICGVLCVKLYYFPGLLFAILHVLC